MNPTNCSTMISGPGRCLRHAEAVEHLARLEPAIMLDCLLGDIGENGVSAAEGDHRHLAEEDGDLAEHVARSQADKQRNDRNEPEHEPDTRGPQRTGNGRPRVLRQFIAEEIIDHAAVVLAGRAVTAFDLECGRAAPAPEKTDQRCAEDNDGKRHGEKEYADESSRREDEHRVVLQRALADPDDSLQNDREDCGLETEKERNDHRHIAVGGINVAECHDGDDARHDEQAAGNDPAERAVHQPADIGSELLRLRSGQQHAVVEGVQESRFRHPVFLLDQDSMHDRDLSGGAAEAEACDPQPHLHGIPERDAVSGRVTTCGCDRQLSHG